MEGDTRDSVDKYYERIDDFVADSTASQSHHVFYDVSRASDGLLVVRLPESSLRYYVPYEAGNAALCNVGGTYDDRNDNKRGIERSFGQSKPFDAIRANDGSSERIIKCLVEEYIEGTPRDNRLLHNEYRVTLNGSWKEERYETILPVWRVQRKNNHDT